MERNFASHSTTSAADTYGKDCPLASLQKYFGHFNLKDTVDHQCFNVDLDQRKIVILFCYDERDQFGRIICDWLREGPVHELLSSRFVVLGLYTSTENRRNDLQISEITHDEYVISAVQTGKSRLFILIPFDNTLISQCYIDQSWTETDTVDMLIYAKLLFMDMQKQQMEEERKSNETQTCETFQQLMMCHLGNRDYDIFFSDEHHYLKEKIRFAYFGPPQSDTMTMELMQIKASATMDKKRRKIELELKKTKERQDRIVENAYGAIISQSAKHACNEGTVVISFIYVCCVKYEPFKDTETKRTMYQINREEFYPVPCFVLRKCYNDKKSGDYCRIIMDSTLRVYTTWQNFLDENKYPKCALCVPTNGKYTCGDMGNVDLDYFYTPACNFSQKAWKAIDISSSVAGVGSGGLLLLAAIPAVALAPVAVTGALVVGAGAGLYTIGRSVYNLVDRKLHDENLSITEAESRAAFINILAGSLGFAGAGANIVLSTLARGGAHIGEASLITVNALSKASIAAGGLAISNSMYDIAREYSVKKEAPSSLVIAQLGASVLFFSHSVYNYKDARTTVLEAQNSVIQEMSDSLLNNRLRSMFHKLREVTLKVYNGDAIAANAEVISAIRNAPSVDETMNLLEKYDRQFIQLGIRFSAENGNVLFNGESMDVAQFSKDFNTAHISDIMFPSLKPLPNNSTSFLSSVTLADVAYTFSNIIKSANIESTTSKIVENVLLNTLQLFTPFVQKRILELIESCYNYITDHNNSNSSNLIRDIQLKMKENGISSEVIAQIINFLIHKGALALNLGPDIRNVMEHARRFAVNHFMYDRPITNELIKECINYISMYFVQKVTDGIRDVEEKAKIKRNNKWGRKLCDKCNGYYHVK